MWLKVLRYAIQFAAATGLLDKAKAWLKKKAEGAITKAEAKIVAKYQQLDDHAAAIDTALGEKPAPTAQ